MIKVPLVRGLFCFRGHLAVLDKVQELLMRHLLLWILLHYIRAFKVALQD